jgi:hypothetical protein
MNQQLFYSAFIHGRVIVFATGIEKGTGRADVFFLDSRVPRGMSDCPAGRAILSGGA